MSTIEQIRLPRQEVFNKTKKLFPKEIELFEEGISLLLECMENLQPEGEKTDKNTPDGASKFAIWRFLSTLPISLTWCLDIALCGDYMIAKNILRLSLEETIKLSYYSAFPNSALDQITKSRDSDDIRLSKMIKKLELEQQEGILGLYKDISNYYSHANLNLPPEILYEENQEIQIGGGSRFIQKTFRGIVSQLLILIAHTLKFTLLRYHQLLENDLWMKKTRLFLENIDYLINDKKKA